MHTTRQSNKHIDDDIAQASMDEEDNETLDEAHAAHETGRGERQLKARRLVEMMLEEKRMRRLAGEDWWDELDEE